MKTTNQITQLAITLMVLCFTQASFSQTWNTAGNAGTNPATNYVGTSDNTDLVLRTFAVEKMRIQAGGNVGIGVAAPVQKLDVKGNINISTNNGIYTNNKRVFFATNSSVTKSNVYAGTNAGFTGTGYYNSFLGTEAGYSNTGAQNTFLGAYSGRNNSSGSQNTFAGSGSGHENTSAGNNSFFGYNAGYATNTGSDNTFLGTNSGALNTTGYHNTFTGSSAGNQNTSGYENTAYGYNSLYSNTTGTGNTALGTALGSVTIGQLNVGIGYGAGGYSVGDYNTLVGSYASQANGGEGNTYIGYLAGAYGDIGFTNSSYSTSLGFFAQNGGYFNSMALGNQSLCTGDNQVVVGNGTITSIGGWEDWTDLSDGRVKKNVRDNVPGLDFINKLEPVTYNLNLEAADQILHRNSIKNIDGKEIAPSPKEEAAKMEKEQILYTGFIAQDVEKAAKEIGYDFRGVDAPKNEDGLYGLRYAKFVVPLVKAVQELSKLQEVTATENQEMELANAELKTQLTQLSTEHNDLQRQLSVLTEKMSQYESSIVHPSTTDGFAKMTFDGSGAITLLGQNIPNPFDHSTLIPFRIPVNCHDASIMITNTATAEVVSVIPVACNEDHLSLDAGTFAAGNYAYTLYVDGKIIATKQMELVR